MNLSSEQREKYLEAMDKHRQEFSSLLERVVSLPPGKHTITVDEVLWKEFFMLDGGDTRVIIRDTSGLIHLLSEDAFPSGHFVSRHSIVPGMVLEITVEAYPPRPTTYIKTAIKK